MRGKLRGSINAKFISMFLLCIILPLAVIASVYSYRLQHLLMRNERDNTATKIDASMAQFEQILLEMNDIISQLSINNSVEALLRSATPLPTYEWFQEYRTFENLLQTVAAKSGRSYRVTALDAAGKVYHAGAQYNAFLTFEDAICRKVLAAGGATVTVNRTLAGIDDTGMLTVGKPFIDRGVTRGLVLVDAPLSTISPIFDLFEKEHTRAYVLDREGAPLYAREPEDAMPLPARDVEALLASGGAEYAFDGMEYIVISQSLSRPGLSIVVLVSKDFIFREPNRLTAQLALALVVTLLVSIAAVILISTTISRNIKRLSREVAAFGREERALDIPIRATDEVGQLARGIEAMSRRITRLLATVRENEHTRWDLEFRALQSQINPHMIYNTLNTIANLARLQNVPNIEEVSTASINLLRMVSGRGGEYISLREELECVRAFVTIKQYNQPWDVRCDITLDPDAADCRVLKLLLQPLVENAIVHGYTGKLPGGLIQVHVRREGDAIHVDILDDGEGIDAQTLAAILTNQLSNDTAFSNVGIYNTWRRLALKYGERASFDIQSRVMGGTAVRIAYPAEPMPQREG